MNIVFTNKNLIIPKANRMKKIYQRNRNFWNVGYMLDVKKEKQMEEEGRKITDERNKEFMEKIKQLKKEMNEINKHMEDLRRRNEL